MAILRMTFRSRELKRDVPVNVVLPFDRGGAKPYPTLYLLHGLQNSCDTWPLNTRIERWASDRGLLVAPSTPTGTSRPTSPTSSCR